MSTPAGPIYASTLHRRDRAWGRLRRRPIRRAMRVAMWAAALGASVALVLQYVA